MIYQDCKIYGPYVSKQDGRKRVVVKFPDGKKKTVSYPKYLVEKHLDRYLEDNETVDHIDNDFRNNDLSNLRVITRKKHGEQDAVRVKDETHVCVWCGKEFIVEGSRLRQRNRRKASGFCSRSCTGKYGKAVQLGTVKPEDIKMEIKKEKYKTKSALGEISSVEELNIGEALTRSGDGNTEA